MGKVFCFFWRPKKKGLANPTKGFLRIFSKTFANTYLEKKKKVRSRQI